MEKLSIKIKEMVEKLPKINQEAISSINWIKTTEDICLPYLLEEDEIRMVIIETALVLLGASDERDFVGKIEGLGLSSPNQESLISKIKELVFIPIARFIETDYKKKIKGEGQEWSDRVKFILSGGDYSYFIKNDKR